MGDAAACRRIREYKSKLDQMMWKHERELRCDITSMSLRERQCG
jgi:hypothetical protein